MKKTVKMIKNVEDKTNYCGRAQLTVWLVGVYRIGILYYSAEYE